MSPSIRCGRRSPAGAWIACVFAFALHQETDAATHVVGPPGDPTADFTTFLSAYSAAAPGDTLFIRPGSYSAGAIPLSKSLTIIGAGADVTVLTTLVLQNFFGMHGKVVIRGLRLQYVEGFGVLQDALYVQGLVRDVAFEDCIIDGPAFVIGTAGAGALSFTRCRFQGLNGGTSTFGSSDGRSGLVATGFGEILLIDCDLIGGNGTTADFEFGGNGASGLSASVRVRAFGSRFVGGNGQAASTVNGVSAAAVQASGSFEHQGCTFTPGTPVGGAPTPPDIQLTGGGTALALAGVPAVMELSAKSEVGMTAGLSLRGEPGATAIFFIGTPPPAFLNVPGALGVYAFGATPLIFVLPALPASGDVAFAPLVPALPAGVESVAIGVQAVVVPASTNPVALSNLSVGLLAIPGL